MRSWTDIAVQRLMVMICGLQDAYHIFHSWEVQGQNMSDLRASTSVVAALSFWDYSLILGKDTGGDAFKATGRCFSVAAGRISYCYALKGCPLATKPFKQINVDPSLLLTYDQP
jgi:hypothetical protein